MNNFPTEILTEIFQYLSASDRKHVRAVCSRWYNACNELQILQTEKLVFNVDRCKSFNLIMQILIKCPFKCLNLEFVNVTSNKFSKSFWITCGPKIHWLSYRKCNIGKAMLRDIIKHCYNLEHLSFTNSNKVYFHLLTGIEKMNDKLTSLSLIDVKVQTIDIGCELNSTFDKIWTLYPNLKKLCYNDIDSFKFPSIYDRIKSSAEKFESLTVLSSYDDKFSDSWFEKLADLPNLRLKELNLVKHCNITCDGFATFFAKQTHLEHVTIDKCKRFTPECLRILLLYCQNLISFTFTSNDWPSSFIVNYELFDMIANSYLKVVKIHCVIKDFEKGSTYSIRELKNTSLRRLYLSGNDALISPYNEYVLSWIRKTFTNLIYFNFVSGGYKTNEWLQLVYKYQIGLDELILYGHDRYKLTDEGFTGISNKNIKQPSSIRQLKNLERLKLINCSAITDITFTDLVFPCLKYLTIECCEKISEAGFISIYKNNPALEYFHLCSADISVEQLVKIVTNLKRLHTLRIEEIIEIKEEYTINTILNCNKSLRHMIFNCVRAYWYNVFSQTWEQENHFTDTYC